MGTMTEIIGVEDFHYLVEYTIHGYAMQEEWYPCTLPELRELRDAYLGCGGEVGGFDVVIEACAGDFKADLYYNMQEGGLSQVALRTPNGWMFACDEAEEPVTFPGPTLVEALQQLGEAEQSPTPTQPGSSVPTTSPPPFPPPSPMQIQALAADLLQMHHDTGISLDNWFAAREVVEHYYGPIVPNGA